MELLNTILTQKEKNHDELTPLYVVPTLQTMEPYPFPDAISPEIPLPTSSESTFA
jgi:hypothetical protein